MRTAIPRLAATLIAFLALACCGCSTGRGGTIQLEPSASSQMLSEQFSNAFFTVSPEGDYDILMVDNASAWEFKKSPRKGAIQPTEITPVRQAFLIHSNWKHRIGTKQSPASVNASLTWYVLGESGDKDLMIYQGIAHVVIHGEATDQHCTVEIIDGTLEPLLVTGNMHDPVGPARLTGNCRALNQAAQLKDILSDMRSRRQSAAPGSALVPTAP
jgi:hypothetical protein